MPRRGPLPHVMRSPTPPSIRSSAITASPAKSGATGPSRQAGRRRDAPPLRKAITLIEANARGRDGGVPLEDRLRHPSHVCPDRSARRNNAPVSNDRPARIQPRFDQIDLVAPACTVFIGPRAALCSGRIGGALDVRMSVSTRFPAPSPACFHADCRPG